MVEKKGLFTTVLTFLLLFSTIAKADLITLHIPIVEESNRQHSFYHELLATSIKEIGHTPHLIEYQLPQLRIKNYLQYGVISLYWMVESEERNELFIPIEVGLTDKLIGQRVLLINKQDQGLYEAVKDLEDFRKLKLTASMGKNWFDSDIWEVNDLDYHEHSGSWKKIFNMIAKGTRHNYFPRGVNEIIVEAEQHPELAVEERLMLIYDRDFRFYLSKTGVNAGAKYEKELKLALKKAQESGLIKRLIDKYWGDDFKKLNYDDRVKIYLQSP